MFLQRFFVEGLAHASYLIGDQGEAAVVDPKRDVDDYLETATANGLKIVAILETHPHADFTSGHIELATRTGAKIYIGHRAPVKYRHEPAKDGQVIRVGSLEVEVLETPGHSPDSVSYLVRNQGKPTDLFTGDTLFVGDVGRPDLRDADEKPDVLAGALYDSLFNKLMKLPDDVKVYPAHGSGSLCGRKISSAPFTTIGQERKFNWALQIKDRGEFVKKMTANLPDRPAYFAADVAINLRGAPPLSELPPLKAVNADELKARAAKGAAVIDTRSAAFFGAGHFPGSLNIGLGSHLFSTWVGFMVPHDRPILLVVGSARNAEKARLELARIGFDNIAGYIEADDLPETAQLSQISVCDLKDALRRGEELLLVDVRTKGEWDSEHIDGAKHVPLPQLPKRLGELPKGAPMAVLCGSGYRSSIAASLMQKNGFLHPQNVMGGMGAYMETQCPEWHPSELVFAGENI